MKVNLFRTLNTMQKALITHPHQFGSVEKAWELRVDFSHRGVTRSRIVSFIQRFKNGYLVTLTGNTYASFMGALSSLIGDWLNSLHSLIRSMMFGYASDASVSTMKAINEAVCSSVGQPITYPPVAAQSAGSQKKSKFGYSVKYLKRAFWWATK